jgi:hypothetical protein
MHDHGASLQLVAAYLGHARLSTAQIYAGFHRPDAGRVPEGASACGVTWFHHLGTRYSGAFRGGETIMFAIG